MSTSPLTHAQTHTFHFNLGNSMLFHRWAGDGPWDRPVSVAVVGDFGLVGAGATFDRLHQLVDDGEVDFIIHLGDIACKRDVMHM